MFYIYRKFFGFCLLCSSFYLPVALVHAEKVEVSSKTLLGSDVKVIQDDEEKLLSKYQEQLQAEKKKMDSTEKASLKETKKGNSLPNEILPSMPSPKVKKAFSKEDKSSQKEDILPVFKEKILQNPQQKSEEAHLTPTPKRDITTLDKRLVPFYGTNNVQESTRVEEKKNTENSTSFKNELQNEEIKKPLQRVDMPLPKRENEKDVFKKITPTEKIKQEATERQQAKMQQEAQKRAKRLQKEAEKAQKEREKRLDAQRVRFKEIFFDDEYTYYVDTKTLKWKDAPHSSNEKILDVWVKAVPKSEGEDAKTYYLDHYYLRPEKEEIMFLAELEVTGRPQNNIADIPYHLENFEKLIPESLEDHIYHAILSMVGYREKSENTKKDIFTKAKEFTEDTLRIYL